MMDSISHFVFVQCPAAQPHDCCTKCDNFT